MRADEVEIRVAWQRHIGRGASADAWCDAVIARHRGSGRHYHGVRHVVWMLRHLADLDRAGHVDHTDVVVAAACFHDAIYDPTSAHGVDERASAELARTALGELGWTPDRIERVAAAVVATTDHDITATTDRNVLAVLAADLAVLATEPAAYGDYLRNVRREYAHVDHDDWRAGRAAVLRRLLERDHLFAPALGLSTWELRARANITAELATLEP